MRQLLGLPLLFLLGCGCTPQLEPIRIFAAASTGPALEVFARSYEAKHQVRLQLNLAASSTLAQQITQGARCDLVLLADKPWADRLEQKGLLEPGSRVDWVSNRLVLVAPKQKPFSWAPDRGAPIEKAFAGPLALADPDHVPAGRYAKAALTSLGSWEPLKKRLLLAPDARAALLWVERAEAPAGIVYETDARTSNYVMVVAKLPESLHPKIVYPMALCSGAKPSARAVYQALLSPSGLEVFSFRGFIVPDRGVLP